MSNKIPYIFLIISPLLLLWFDSEAAIYLARNMDTSYDVGNNYGDFVAFLLGVCFFIIVWIIGLIIALFQKSQARSRFLYWLIFGCIAWFLMESLTPWENQGVWRLIHYLESIVLSLVLSSLGLMWLIKKSREQLPNKGIY